jgi:signal transduction histidine kinase
VRNAQLYAETRLRADQLAQANARLEAQDALRRELVYQITHDIRGPLQVIYGYADVILDGLLGPVTDAQRDILQMMIKRSRSIEAMTEDIMAVGPISRQVLNLAPVDLIALCLQAARDARMAYPDERYRFETICQVPHLIVLADYNRLNRVFDNLLNNAVKFSPQGGTITLLAGLDPTGAEAQISVSDQGVGIDSESLPYVFERFYRGHHTGQARVDGSGLGLFIAQQIIEAHNGRVWVDSQEGAGSTFTFCLPLAER